MAEEISAPKSDCTVDNFNYWYNPIGENTVAKAPEGKYNVINFSEEDG